MHAGNLDRITHPDTQLIRHSRDGYPLPGDCLSISALVIMSQPAMLFEKLRDDIAAGILSPGRRLSQQRIAIRYEVTKVLTAESGVSGLPASHQILVEPIERRGHDTAEKRMRCHVQSDFRFGLQEFLESRSA